MRYFSIVCAILCTFGLLYFALNQSVASADVLQKYLEAYKENGFDVTIEGLEDSGKTGKIDSLTIKKEGEINVSLSYEGLEFDQLDILEDGTLKGVSLKAEKVAFTADEFSQFHQNYELRDFTLPFLTKLLDFDEFNKVTEGQKDSDGKRQFKLEEIYTYFGGITQSLSQLSFSDFSSDKVTFKIENSIKKLTYEFDGVVADSLKNGKLEELKYASLVVSPEDNKDAEFFIRSGEGIFKNYDFTTFGHVFDDANYKNGKGDDEWLPVIGEGIIHDIATEENNTRGDFKIAKVSFDTISIRQFDKPFKEVFETIFGFDVETTDEQAKLKKIAHMPYHLYRMFKLENVIVDEIALDDKSTTNFSMSKFKLDSYTYDDGIKTLNFHDIIAGNNRNGFKFKNLTVGNIQFPKVENVIDIYDELLSKTPGDSSNIFLKVATLSPTIGSWAFDELSVYEKDERQFGIDHLAFSLKNYVNFIPTDIQIDISKVDIPLVIEDRRNRFFHVLKDLDYQDLIIDSKIALKWDEATGDVEILPSRVSAQEIGEIELKGLIGNIPRQAIAEPEKATALLLGASFKEMALSYKDASFTNRFFENEAEKKGLDVEALKMQYTNFLALPLTFLKSPDFLEKVQKVAQDFLKKPNEIHLSAKPEKPLPFVGLGVMFRTNPDKIVESLQLDIVSN